MSSKSIVNIIIAIDNLLGNRYLDNSQRTELYVKLTNFVEYHYKKFTKQCKLYN